MTPLLPMLRLTQLSLSLLALWLAASPGSAEVPFTVEQAERGEILYQRQCAHCHGDELWDGAASPLVGSDFLVAWRGEGKSLWDLYDATWRTMPVSAEASLAPDEMADLLAFILERNRFSAGELPLDPDPEALRQIDLGPAQAQQAPAQNPRPR